MTNLADGLNEEITRCEELLREYEGLPDGAGMFGAPLIRNSLTTAKKARDAEDVVAMLTAYNDLKGCE